MENKKNVFPFKRKHETATPLMKPSRTQQQKGRQETISSKSLSKQLDKQTIQINKKITQILQPVQKQSQSIKQLQSQMKQLQNQRLIIQIEDTN